MPTTQATVRAGKGSAIFRMIFGFAFICLGLYRHFADGATAGSGVFTLIIGALFFGYGLIALLSKGTVVQIESQRTGNPATDRLAELLSLKNQGLITEQEFEQKRQDILKSV